MIIRLFPFLFFLTLQAAPTLKQHTVTIDGHPFALFEKRGENADKTILLLHGRTWSSLPNFDLVTATEDLSLMNALAARGFAVYALDMRGYGKTPRDASGWLSPQKAARDLTEVLRRLKDISGLGDVPAVFGWSFGSTIAHLAARNHPDLLSHLILYGYWKDPDTQIPEEPDPEKHTRRVNNEEHAASDFIIPGSISKEAVDAYVKMCLEADPVRVDFRRLHQFNALDPARLTMPVLLLHGAGDPYVKPEAHASLFTRLGTNDKEWVSIAGGDHAAHLENVRDRFIDALVTFIRRPGGKR
ncbi:MAG: alpha/beta fold hydrolase [Acidobacteriota bacterium]|nr:alpha/beta fold hydrolase [Acidobacteriota bacterium]